MAKIGRPLMDPKERKSEQLTLRVTPALVKLITVRASQNGTSPTYEARIVLYEEFGLGPKGEPE